MNNKIYVHEFISPEQKEGLERDTGSRAVSMPSNRYNHSPLVCPYCGNRNYFNVDITFDVEAEIIDGQLVLPDIKKEISGLINGFHYNSVHLVAGYLELLKSHYGRIPLPLRRIDGSLTSLSEYFYEDLDDMAEIYVDHYLDSDIFECVNCDERVDFRDSLTGYGGLHDDMCSGCFVCSTNFLSAKEVAEKCSNNLSEVLPVVFPDEMHKARHEDIPEIQESLTGRLDNIAMHSSVQDCHECEHYYLCLNYGLHQDHPDILVPAITKAIEGGKK